MDLFFETAITDREFELIDFCAEWCEPCKWIAPILDEINNHYNGKIKIQKIDIDQHVDTARAMHILSVPTLVLFRSGKEVWRMRGFDTPSVLIGKIDSYIN
jgi:thioredoxin 1